MKFETKIFIPTRAGSKYRSKELVLELEEDMTVEDVFRYLLESNVVDKEKECHFQNEKG